MSLWLARHGRPLLEPGICYGALDIAADPAMTLAAGQRLSAALPPGMAVQVSPLVRCQQLAQCLRTLRSDLHFQTDARLREMDFGCWEGVAWSDIPRAAIDTWSADFAQHCFGGRESANMVLARVASAFDALSPGRDALWITHGGVAQAVTLLAQGLREVRHAQDWPLSRLEYGRWMVFDGGGRAAALSTATPGWTGFEPPGVPVPTDPARPRR